MSAEYTRPVIQEQDVASLGWRTAEDQLRLYEQHLVILGSGGAGGGVAEGAAREGMRVSVADPDDFDISNLNRQVGSYIDTVGKNKARTVAELIRRIRPAEDAVRVFEDGVQHETMSSVLKGASLILDAIDIGRPDLSVAVARAARAGGIPVFMGIEIGYGASITCFDPSDDLYTAEHFFGLSNDEEVTKDTDIPLENMLIHMPSYTPAGMLDAFAGGELPSTPGIAPGVQILTGFMLSAIDRWVLDRQHSTPRFVYPYMAVFDPIDGLFSVHADDRKAHLEASLHKMGTNMQSSGFSLPSQYDTM